MSVRVVVVGAGIGGLVAALLLSDRGHRVTVIERADAPGGKMREVGVGDDRIDAGPTVLTMRGVFEEVFASVGESLAAHVTLTPAAVLARHAWSRNERLDLFADVEQTAAAIEAFSDRAEAERYRRFRERTRQIFETLEGPFIQAEGPSVAAMVRAGGIGGLARLSKISPFATMWKALGAQFRDPRLRQLFGRYATYCGSSPFLAPATLMLIAHVEQQGVWLVAGGMHRLAAALADRAAARGADFRYGLEARRIDVEWGRVGGVVTSQDERLAADAVVFNGDVSALAEGLLGDDLAGVTPRLGPSQRSLSAVTWALSADTAGFPLSRHNVFFSPDYPAEFDDILGKGRLPARPTVYVCAQDRDATGASRAPPRERLLCLVNAPGASDVRSLQPEEIARCENGTFAFLETCGLRIQRSPQMCVRTTPAGFARMYPGTGGALYGRASHGWMASFQRPSTRTRLPGLYLAGGSVHPGPGVPMAAISGRRAASSLMEDLASTSRSRRAATAGGTSTHSARDATRVW